MVNEANGGKVTDESENEENGELFIVYIWENERHKAQNTEGEEMPMAKYIKKPEIAKLCPICHQTKMSNSQLNYIRGNGGMPPREKNCPRKPRLTSL